MTSTCDVNGAKHGGAESMSISGVPDGASGTWRRWLSRQNSARHFLCDPKLKSTEICLARFSAKNSEGPRPARCLSGRETIFNNFELSDGAPLCFALKT